MIRDRADVGPRAFFFERQLNGRTLEYRRATSTEADRTPVRSKAADFRDRRVGSAGGFRSGRIKVASSPRHADERLEQSSGCTVGSASRCRSIGSQRLRTCKSRKLAKVSEPPSVASTARTASSSRPCSTRPTMSVSPPVSRTARGDVECRRYIAVVENKLLVADLSDPCDTQRHASVGLIAGDSEAEVGEAELDRLGHSIVGESVGNVLLGDGEPRLMRSRHRPRGTRRRRAAPPEGSAKQPRRVHPAGTSSGGGGGSLVRDRERLFRQAALPRRAAGRICRGSQDPRPRVMEVKPQAYRLHAVHAGTDLGVEITLLGLEVLRSEEHPLAPGYAVLPGHAQAPVGLLVKHSFTSSESCDIVLRSPMAEKWGDGPSQSTAATTSPFDPRSWFARPRAHPLPLLMRCPGSTRSRSRSIRQPGRIKAPRSSTPGGARPNRRHGRHAGAIASSPRCRLSLLLVGGMSAYLSRSRPARASTATIEGRSSFPRLRSRRQFTPGAADGAAGS